MVGDTMQYRYRQPKNEDAFEEFCLVLLQQHWSLPTLSRYGHRGERQDGVDLVDTGGGSPLRGVQCKHHDQSKTLPPRELEAEVAKARSFPEKLEQFFLLTTAKKSAAAQRKVRQLNEEHAKTGQFVVQLFTWDDIERIIDDCPAAQDFLGVQGPQALRRELQAALRPVHDALRASGDDAHAGDLDEVKKYLDSGELQLARLLLGRARARIWDQLAPRQRARWCTLRADVELRDGKEAEAARLLTEAQSYQPDDDNTVSNRIIALELVGDRAGAHQAALEEATRRPHVAAIYASLLRTAPSYEDSQRLLDARPPMLRDDPEVWVAAATRADATTAGTPAESVARRAVELASDDSRPWFALGNILIASEFAKLDPEAPPSSGVVVTDRLTEARSCFSRVIELSAARGVTTVQARALLRRATAATHLGDTNAAREDVEEARRIARDDPAVLVSAALLEQERDNYDESVKLLRQVVMRKEDGEAQFLLGVALWNRNGSGDRAEAVALLLKVANADAAHSAIATDLAVDGLIADGRHDAAREHVERMRSTVDGCLLETCLARVAAAAGTPEEASLLCTGALSAISPTTSRGTLRRLGKMLMALGRLNDAVPVWDRLAEPGVVTVDTRSLVECLGRLGQDGKVMSTCADARKAGVHDPFLLGWELRLLDRYDPDTALEVLKEWSARQPDLTRPKLHLVHLAIRLNRLELAEQHLATLPAVTEVDAEEGAAVVAALVKLGHGVEAIPYSYDLLRRHFQDHNAHRAFRDAIMWREQKGELEVPGKAGPGVAVSLLEHGATAPQWFVIEDSSVDAIGVDDEIRPDSALAQKLADKKVGDEVVLSEGAGIRLAAIVQELLPKYVFRIRDVWDRWQYRFPEHQEIWRVRLPPSSEDAKPDFSSIHEMLKEQHRRRREAEDLYRSQPIPLKVFGDALGRSELQALGHLASTDGVFLRCCRGRREEYVDAIEVFASAAEVVLDITALGTLLMLEALRVLDVLGKKAIVTHATMAALRAFVEESRSRLHSEAAMASDDDGPVVVMTTAAQRQATLSEGERFLAAVEEKCQIVGCSALAHVEPTDRDQMGDVLGLSALESSVVAASSSRVLWTDDLVVADVAREKFGARRMWTQAVLRWLAEQGVEPVERYVAASARMLGWGYAFTGVNPDIMRAAGNLAEWAPMRWPLRQAIKNLSSETMKREDAAVLAATTIAHCYVGAVVPETRHGVLQAVCEAVSARPDGDGGLPLVRAVLDRAFGLNAVGRDDALKTFDAWRAEQRRRVSAVR